MKTVVLNYRADFVSLVQSGSKPHTIRACRTDGLDPLPGDLLQHYANWGTKDAYIVRQEVCTYTSLVTIQPSAGNVHHILLGGTPVSQSEVDLMARVDGFPDGAALVRYFEQNYGLPFTGLLIGWEPAPVYVTRH